MSDDVNPKVPFPPLPPSPGKKPPAGVDGGAHPERCCAFCVLPISGYLSVLLDSGRSVHFDCYIQMRKMVR